jgi:hypothetical protein
MPPKAPYVSQRMSDSFMITSPRDTRDYIELDELNPSVCYAKDVRKEHPEVEKILLQRIIQGSSEGQTQPPFLTVDLPVEILPNGSVRAHRLLADYATFVRRLRINFIVSVDQNQSFPPLIRFRATEWVIPLMGLSGRLDSLIIQVTVLTKAHGTILRTGTRESEFYARRLQEFLFSSGESARYPGRTLHERLRDILKELLAWEKVFSIDFPTQSH